MSREYWSWKFWSAGPIFSLENMVRLCKNWSGLKDARFTSSFLNRTQHDSSSTKGSLGNSVVYRRTSSPVIASESIPTDHSLDLRCCRQLDLQWPLPSVPADCRSPSSCLTRCNSSPKLSISVCSRVSAYVGNTTGYS